MSKDEMIGWHHQLNGHEYEQALGVGDGHGSKELDMTDTSMKPSRQSTQCIYHIQSIPPDFFTCGVFL